jgi:hypothetical protein
MNHSVSQVAGPHEAKIRLLRTERKIENEKLGQLKIKLLATPNAKKSVAGRMTTGASETAGRTPA